MQTAQLAGRTELLSKPLHYVNCLTTQITTLHTSTRSARKTHILSVPGPSTPAPPSPPCHSPTFITAAEVRQKTAHTTFRHHLGKCTGAKVGDATELSMNRCSSRISGRTSLSRTRGLHRAAQTPPALPDTGFQDSGDSLLRTARTYLHSNGTHIGAFQPNAQLPPEVSFQEDCEKSHSAQAGTG